MGKHVFLSVLAGTLLALVAGVYLMSFKDPHASHAGYPWQIEQLASGHTRVFSLTIGQSTLGDAEKLFKGIAEITLFAAPESVSPRPEPVIEAFFSEVNIGGLKSKMVLTLDLPADEIETMMNRGARIATLGSGIRKVTLSSEDASRAREFAIASITYLPSINLSAELIEKRFGEPAEKIADTESDGIHWLYPEQGIDIAISEENKEVFQYVLPAKFTALVAPLKLEKVSAEKIKE